MPLCYVTIPFMSFNDWSLLLTAGASLLLSAIFFLAARHQAANRYLSLLALSVAGWCLAQVLGGLTMEKELVLFWTKAGLASTVAIPICYFAFVNAFAGFPRQDNRWPALAALLLVILLFTPWFVSDVAPRFAFGFYPVAGPVYPFFALYLFALFIWGGLRLWRSRSRTGEAGNYVLLASLVGLVGGGTSFLPAFGIDFPLAGHFTLPVSLAIIAYAVIRKKLLNIKIVIKQGLVYSSLTFFFTGIYVAVILLANLFFHRFTSFSETLIVLAVVLFSVLLFQPLKDSIQRLVDRWFFRGSYYYEQRLQELAIENQTLYEKLFKADKLAALGTLAAGMAHEIKNPLAAINGLTQVLPENLHDPEFLAKYQEIVSRQIGRIDSLVRDLLAFGRPAPSQLGRCDLSLLLEESCRLVESQCRKKGIELIRDWPATLLLEADAGKLVQALLNIILNAIEALPTGGRIKISAFAGEGGSATVRVIDNGHGITLDKLAKIFDPFYTTKEEGTGMGLAVTYRIIKDHGGEITAESSPEKGTIFTICLPIRSERSV